MYRIVIVCPGVPEPIRFEAAAWIQREFEVHRAHHSSVCCTFEGDELTLTADNDFDANGLALLDEFSDCISAYFAETPGDGSLEIKSVTMI